MVIKIVVDVICIVVYVDPTAAATTTTTTTSVADEAASPNRSLLPRLPEQISVQSDNAFWGK